RGGFLTPASRQRFIRIRHHEAARVVFYRFYPSPITSRVGAESRYIHRPHVDGRLAVDDPFRHAESDAAGLTETGHYANGNPVVGKARHWSDHRIAVGPEGERSIEHPCDSSASERGHSCERAGERIVDAIEIARQKFVAEVQRRAGNRPRLAIRLV